MLTRAEMTENVKTVFVDNIVPCLWTKSKTLNIGKRETFNKNENKDILLTENDVNFFPTQENLKEFNYFVPKEIAHKFYKPFYQIREVNKSDKVLRVITELNILE